MVLKCSPMNQMLISQCQEIRNQIANPLIYAVQRLRRVSLYLSSLKSDHFRTYSNVLTDVQWKQLQRPFIIKRRRANIKPHNISHFLSTYSVLETAQGTFNLLNHSYNASIKAPRSSTHMSTYKWRNQGIQSFSNLHEVSQLVSGEIWTGCQRFASVVSMM